ncbi:hypothetical protein L3X37_13945 [Sabulilitoribacter arenilitoris]|uniref:Uncharacterized protein n=1 Tax=Wocania arenilitoris TaxID=2044858 RepID=A0AAE3JML4_9FLAO|nr:hypothetical protein [Wocania arenilitoris]MCF7569452.1 hypothetical protein [Wocania arenilitoris]
MTEKIKSEGECVFCEKKFKKSGINRHLQTHLAKKVIKNAPGKSFHIKVETNPYWGSTPYFLSLWIDGEAKMKNLDTFLRDIWLECCGHLSSFTNPKNKKQDFGMFDYFEAEELLEKGKIKEYEQIMEHIKGEVPMSRKAKNTLCKGLKLEYDYDFGSTTSLLITVLNEYTNKADKNIMLLSRNEFLNIPCEMCSNKPSVVLCSACYEQASLFCTTCATKHSKTCEDFNDYASMHIVNSPRMGVCCYGGGTIDTKRDGILNVK